MTAEAPDRPVVRAPSAGARAGRFVDGCLDVAVAGFGLWTLLCWGVLAGLPLMPVLGLWALGTAGIAAWRVRRPWLRDADAPGGPGGPALPDPGGARTWVALAAALAAAALASVVSRPDADDASFVARSTWVADHGALPAGDFVFGEPGWPATFGSVPNVSSIEALFGALARATGLPTGDVVYRYFVPLAAFAAVWALWVLLRAWHARRPLASLALALAFLLLGGYAHATFGNMHLARIWQGKAVLLAVLVPYLHACVALLWRRRATGRADLARTAAVLAATGLAAVGCSSTGVFLAPLIAGSAALALLVARRWLEAVVLVVATSAGPAVAGVMTVLSPVGARNEGGRATGWLWVRVLGDEPAIWALVAAAGLLVLAGLVRPRWCAALDRPAQIGLSLTLLAGFACTVPPAYPVLTALMGGDAIAFRLAWVLPVPAVVGLVASLPARRLGLPVLPAVALALAAVLAAGQPLWSAANGAAVGRPGAWKVRDQADLAVARWIVDQEPRGRYLAPGQVALATGVLTSELRPVGSRMDYVLSLGQVPGSQVEQRALLQGVADGDTALRVPENAELVRSALDDLDVTVACVLSPDPFTAEAFAGWAPGVAVAPWACWSR
ncbi:DUF6077 domain-containing protein [Cellulomonas sp.]|uniref:DUF6077 domain-containing protein n=1 Tax=Cellulomonas sp. TaxID=40001 RepID=UPI002D4458FE|nr:DUF6077 domain-containing protein [Cellulomonas sp.]HYQ74702.1 DUF6077 domain-containing protein [Cellulomonas sp.]